MKVVIVGPRDKKELAYVQVVNDIIDSCKEKYAKLLIITKSPDAGVGKIIRSRCLRGDNIISAHKKPEFDMLEINVRHYLSTELPQSEFQSNFDALNATLVELGDEFHIIVEDMVKGNMRDLLNRLSKSGRPVATYGPTELKSGAKDPHIPNSQ